MNDLQQKKELGILAKTFFSQPDYRDPEADHACYRHLYVSGILPPILKGVRLPGPQAVMAASF